LKIEEDYTADDGTQAAPNTMQIPIRKTEQFTLKLQVTVLLPT
jgi:hypothetical protein